MDKNIINYLDVKNNIFENNDIEYIYSEDFTSTLKNKLNIENKKNVYGKKTNNIINNEELSFTQICNIPLPEPTQDENIIFEIENKEKYINKLIQDSNDWTLTDEEYNEIINKTNVIKKEIKGLENELLNSNNTDNDIQPNVNIKINGINIEDVNLNDIFNINNYVLKKEEQKIVDIIKNMKEDIKIYNKKIKEYIKYTINDDYFKFILINNLNKIEIMMNLFEDNYKDILKME